MCFQRGRTAVPPRGEVLDPMGRVVYTTTSYRIPSDALAPSIYCLAHNWHHKTHVIMKLLFISSKLF